MRLLAIAVLQPIATPILSAACPLITPRVPAFWIQNDGAVVTVMRTVETRMSHTGDAALVSNLRSFGLGVPGSCAKVRAAIAQAGALTGAGCVYCGVSVGRQICATVVSQSVGRIEQGAVRRCSSGRHATVDSGCRENCVAYV